MSKKKKDTPKKTEEIKVQIPTQTKKKLREKLLANFLTAFLKKYLKKKSIKWILAILIFLFLLTGFLNKYLKLRIPEDHILEETVENIIEGNTGIKIDLTPISKEK